MHSSVVKVTLVSMEACNCCCNYTIRCKLSHKHMSEIDNRIQFVVVVIVVVVVCIYICFKMYYNLNANVCNRIQFVVVVIVVVVVCIYIYVLRCTTI